MLNLWISSMKRMVLRSSMPSASLAFWTASSMSFFPAVVALICTNREWVVLAMTWAMVVFPVPGGPYRMSEPILSARIALERSLSGPIMCSCPTTSSRVRGLMRLARGASRSRTPFLVYSNRSMSRHGRGTHICVLRRRCTAATAED